MWFLLCTPPIQSAWTFTTSNSMISAAARIAPSSTRMTGPAIDAESALIRLAALTDRGQRASTADSDQVCLNVLPIVTMLLRLAEFRARSYEALSASLKRQRLRQMLLH